MKRILLLLCLAFSLPLVSCEQDIDETIREAESGNASAQYNLWVLVTPKAKACRRIIPKPAARCLNYPI